MVLKAIKYIRDECSITSCDECEFSTKDGDCKLTEELSGSPCSIDIERVKMH